MWKQSCQALKPEITKLTSPKLIKPIITKNTAILPSINKDRPYSEDNVTHQSKDFHSANKDKFMASISHNREITTLRKKMNAIQSQGGLFTEEIKSLKDFNKLELKNLILDPLQLSEKKGYVEKIRRGLIEAKKFDNPALYEMIKKENPTERLDSSVANVSLEEIKDEMNVIFYKRSCLNLKISS